MINNPTKIVLNHVDQLDHAVYGKTSLTPRAKQKVREIEQIIENDVALLGTAPDVLFRN